MSNLALYDTLQNVVANLATGKSKTVSDAFVTRIISDDQLIAMYRSDWMSRKIVDIPVRDALRPRRDWQADANTITRIEDAEKRHQVWAKLARALKWDRIYGGSAILILNGDARMDQPLRTIARGRLRLVVLTRREIQPVRLVDDAMRPDFREPEQYQLTTGTGAMQYVHPSRVIRIISDERPDPEYNPDGWSDSKLQIVYDAIHHAALTSAGIAELVHEAKIDIVRVPRLGDALSTPAGVETITKRFSLASMLKSINNMLLLGDGEDYQTKTQTFGGLNDILKSYLQIVAGAADIPAPRLLGQAPGGLNASGDTDMQNYYDHIESYRQDVIRPALERIDWLLWLDEFGTTMPSDIWWEWGPLWQMSEKDKAEIAAKKAETTEKYIGMGLIPEHIMLPAVANQLVEDGVYPGLDADELERAIAEIRSARNGEGEEPGGEGDDPAAGALDRWSVSRLPRFA